MATIRKEEKILCFKIVYCGTALGGKTTNLKHIHTRLDPSGRGELISLSTAADRTLFFDFLSIESQAMPGYRTLFQLYTVPGQVTYSATMQLVLKQADGVVFVADSQMDRQRDNIQAWQNMEASLRLNGSSVEKLPIVLQYNKRDLPNAAPVEYMEFLLNNRQKRYISFESEAAHGRNILATLNAVSQCVLTQFHERVLRERIDLENDGGPPEQDPPEDLRTASLRAASAAEPVRQPSLVA